MMTTSAMRECDAAHVHSSAHRDELATSTSCGCFFCFRIFGYKEIDRWIDGNQTALCPKCGIDAVLGDASGFPIGDAFLRRMHRHWFTMHTKHR
jgi:hypothetical protein